MTSSSTIDCYYLFDLKNITWGKFCIYEDWVILDLP